MKKKFPEIFMFLTMVVIAVLFWGLAMTGAVQNYSPVPYWDMWNGYVDFYVKVLDGNWSAWWAQHNEHRILLARLFFWIDLHWLRGSVWFLLLINYMLMAITCFTFWQLSKEVKSPGSNFIGLFLVIWLTCWSQSENLVWGFQSQFFLAQLLPLLAFIQLNKSAVDTKKNSQAFFLACFAGVLSLGTMANGVLVLPIMLLYVLFSGFSWRRVAIIAALCLFGLLVYFYNYHKVAHHHGSLSEALSQNPLGLIRYVCLYLGGPFYHMFLDYQFAHFAAQVSGAVFLVVMCVIGCRLILQPRKSTLQLAMFAFIVYIVGTAVGTGGGRLFLGEEQALAGRYTTPSLMAWAALTIAVLGVINPVLLPLRFFMSAVFLAVSLLMIPLQLRAAQSQSEKLFAKKTAVLALRMKVSDQQQISHVCPSAQWCFRFSEAASAKDLSIFGRSPFVDVREDQLGRKISTHETKPRNCQGHLDSVQLIDGDSRFLRVQGWFHEHGQTPTSQLLWLTDQNVLVGYALLGQSREDVALVAGSSAAHSGFLGYVRTNTYNKVVTFVNPRSNCSFSVILGEAAKNL